MKKLTLLLLIAPFHLFAQKQYLIKGRVKNVKYPAKIFLSYRRDGEKSHWDSTVIKNGEFTFKGTLSDTVMATLLVDPQGKGLDDIWKKIM
jgi:hypothetical protein